LIYANLKNLFKIVPNRLLVILIGVTDNTVYMYMTKKSCLSSCGQCL